MENTQALKSDRLGTEPIGKLIMKMSGPAILSMMVQALYNIVDSIFIGMFDATNGVLALAYALPMQLLVNAFAIGFAVGTGSVISRKLGEGKNVDAGAAAQTGILLALVCGAVFLIVGYFLSEGFILAYTSSAPQTDAADLAMVTKMGTEYLAICTCCSVSMMIEIMLNRILQSMGNMIVPMITQIIGAVTNIVLDPIFILVWDMGAAGAAIATVIGQSVAMCIPIFVILKGKWDIQIFFEKGFRLKKDILKEIVKVGLPSIILNAIGSIMYMTANFILNAFRDAVWAFGVYFKVQSFVFMPVFGLNQGCMPIMGYNYGAGNRKRFDMTFRLSMLIAFCYMTVGLTLFHTLPEVLLGLFSPDTANKIAVGTEALRICSIAFPVAAISVIMIAMFNSVGKGVTAMLISLLRQIGILLPLGYCLSAFTDLGLLGVWIAFPIAEAITTVVFIPIALHTINRIFKLKETERAFLNAKKMPLPITDEMLSQNSNIAAENSDSDIAETACMP